MHQGENERTGNDFSAAIAAAIAYSNYVAAAGMTSLQQQLSAIAGRNFAAVDCSNHVAAVDMTSLQQSLSARAGSNLAALV